ncbi:MAG: TIR domain-containing protein [Bacteroidales bacterium]|nr:TIR domain-containing protein [Bacteroidales bacterium]
MKHKCYISFKREDENYKRIIQGWVDKNKIDVIDKSLNEPINSNNEEYIMRRIRQDYLSDSTVTIFLIGEYSSEDLGYEEQKYIKRELQASLYNGVGNSRSGILGVVLPHMYDKIYKGSYQCITCGGTHTWVAIGDSTVIKEFSKNYYLNSHGKCSYAEEDRYCVLVKWSDFSQNPNTYIDMAFNKRSQPIANDVIVRPK